MKKIGVISTVLLLSTFLTSSALASSPSIILDGKNLSFDTSPKIENNRTLVPLRTIFEALGAKVDWDGDNNSITATKDGSEIKLFINGKAYKNFQEINLDLPAKIVNGRTLVPLRFVSETLGCQVNWDNNTETVMINSSKNTSDTSYSPIGVYLDLGKQSSWANSKNVVMDDNGIPQVKYGNDIEYNPTTISSYGLQEYSYYLINHDNQHLQNAIKVADWLIQNQDQKNGEWYYHFNYTIDNMNVKMKSPWYSSMAQGQAMSLLTRIYKSTNDIKYLKSAELALMPFKIKVSDGGVVQDFYGHPWYEEYPSTPPSFTLNGFMFTLIGLYDLYSADPNSGAGKFYFDGIDTLSFALPYYETGGVSAYNLGHKTKPGSEMVQSAAYHKVHITLLDVLNSITPNDTLKKYHDLWSSYVK